MHENKAIKVYKTAIVSQLEALHVYKAEFDLIISVFAQVLAERDAVYAQYIAEGAQPVIEKVSDRGARNTGKNPLLQSWQDLNEQCRKFSNELGLSPASLKRLSDQKIQPPRQMSPLEKAIAKFEQEYGNNAEK
ncbi:MAG: P27 family phage terminase small subunit [Ruminococcus sp.]|nr:P27 family phage terminase small subunit [Ruminococcus sp.]